MKTKSELPKDAGTPLTAWRRKSAEMSGGKSGEHIYELIDRVIEEQGSKGNVIDFGAGQGTYAQRLFLSGRFEQGDCT